jgi:hypothetical protein
MISVSVEQKKIQKCALGMQLQAKYRVLVNYENPYIIIRANSSDVKGLVWSNLPQSKSSQQSDHLY